MIFKKIVKWIYGLVYVRAYHYLVLEKLKSVSKIIHVGIYITFITHIFTSDVVFFIPVMLNPKTA